MTPEDDCGGCTETDASPTNTRAVQHALVREATPMTERAARRAALLYAGILDEDDLLASAMLGVARAAAHYDPARGVPFPRFAIAWAVGEMRSAVRKEAAYADRQRNIADVVTAHRRSRARGSEPPSSGVVPALRVNLLGHPSRSSGDEVVIACEQRSRLRDAMRRELEGKEGRKAALVRMHVLDGETLGEASSFFGVSYATAKRWVADVLERVRARWTRDRVTPVPMSEIPEVPSSRG